MKTNYLLVLLLIGFFSCNSNDPVQFSTEALNDTFISLQGNEVTFQSILEKHKGKTIVIDIWASWCKDCIEGMPKLKALQTEYKDVSYVFLSMDRGEASWKKGIEKYDVAGDHYYMQNGEDCPFADFVDISWIPRYMVINKASEIVVFDVIESDDENLIEAIKN
ncbi:TlpA family protein disulfide reductase [Flavivirga eckloniae]|nr:TlpA disulfide reductase family protein [Flavivirga eckloniae]